MTMREIKPLWAVYLMTVHNQTAGIRSVCEQSEWDAMEHARPGYHRLIQGNLASEVEAEKLARCDPATLTMTTRGVVHEK